MSALPKLPLTLVKMGATSHLLSESQGFACGAADLTPAALQDRPQRVDVHPGEVFCGKCRVLGYAAMAAQKPDVAQGLIETIDKAITPKRIHRAAKIRQDGAVAALCFKVPRKIDLARASWTLSDGAVTCKKCMELMKARKR